MVPAFQKKLYGVMSLRTVLPFVNKSIPDSPGAMNQSSDRPITIDAAGNKARDQR
jgi:hypothetical protein